MEIVVNRIYTYKAPPRIENGQKKMKFTKKSSQQKRKKKLKKVAPLSSLVHLLKAFEFSFFIPSPRKKRERKNSPERKLFSPPQSSSCDCADAEVG